MDYFIYRSIVYQHAAGTVSFQLPLVYIIMLLVELRLNQPEGTQRAKERGSCTEGVGKV